MSSIPNIKPLKPVVQYDPRDAPKGNYGTSGSSGQTVEQGIPFLNFTSALASMFPATNPDLLGRVAHGQGAAQIGGEQPVISDPRDAGVVSATPTVTYDPLMGTSGAAASQAFPAPGVGGGNPTADRRYDALEESRMRQLAAMNSAVTNNRANTQAAQAAGDNVNLARLNAEWERLTQSPLYQQMYGGSDANAMKQRLVNVYMKPGNPAAANDLAGAMSAAVADDVWAREAVKAGVLSSDPNDPRNALLWDEHWKAMNVGGRDPLEGHPQAIQNIKATMQGFSNNNQQTAYDDYSNWAGGH